MEQRKLSEGVESGSSVMMQGRVVSVHVGATGTLDKEADQALEMAIDGIVGDRHRGATRTAWATGAKQVGGTVRRNERQWSAIAHEDVEKISAAMSLAQPLTAGAIAVNLCIEGIPDFSRLPRGTTLSFESGVVLMVEEYNPPCGDMALHVSKNNVTTSGESPPPPAFSEAAKFCRGLVGVVEVPGFIRPGDQVTVEAEPLPKWLRT